MPRRARSPLLTAAPRRPGAGALRLGALARAVGAELAGDGTVLVQGVRHDSRSVEPGDLFVARRGRQADGMAFAAQAIARGAVAVMVDAGRAPVGLPVPLLRCPDVRLGMARAAALVYGDPFTALDVVGVTGTNGKTTTVALVRAALETLGRRPATLGTFGAELGSTSVPTCHNTPEADELARLAARFAIDGASHLVMEVTSHALAEQRADGIRFRVAAFTNLTHDHLDLHGSMAAYGAAKARLFDALRPRTAALVVDDPFGRALAETCAGPVLRVSTDPRSDADVRPVAGTVDVATAIRCRAATPAGTVALASPRFGQHNLANLLLALAILIGLGEEPHQAAAALSALALVPGRLEPCHEPGDDIQVFVDYAHSPDALDKALRAVRPLTRHRVLCVFGCGGDRDRTKRAAMGEAVGRLADVAVVTSDNPRSEPPAAIAQAIVAGLAGHLATYRVELDRARAIANAIASAAPGDLVLIAGKGHETTQVVGSTAHPFDDRAHARRAIAARAGRG